MFKFVAIVLMAIVAIVAAKPGVIAPIAYSAPLVAAAPASAVVSREYHGNGFAAPYFAAPYTAAYTAPYAAAYSAPYAAAYSAPLIAAPAAYSAPLIL